LTGFFFLILDSISIRSSFFRIVVSKFVQAPTEPLATTRQLAKQQLPERFEEQAQLLIR
jgi:hypothetical protein